MIKSLEELINSPDLEKTKTLDLSDRKLKDADLEALIPKLMPLSLTSLNLNKNKLTHTNLLTQLPSLQKLFIEGNRIENIEGLGNLEDLEELHAGYNTQLKDISVLKDLKNIKTLHLENGKIEDIIPLKELKKLNSLLINRNKIKDINCLQGNTEIQWLDLSHNTGIKDYCSIANLTKLKTLRLHTCDLSALDFVEELVDLEFLEINNSKKITDFNVLKNLINLKRFEADNVPEMKNLDVLKSSVKLERLSVSNTSSLNIDYLGDFNDLKMLTLINCKITDISVLKTAVNLTHLNLENNQIEYLPEWLIKLPKLTNLIMRFNPIKNLPENSYNFTYDIAGWNNLLLNK
jgi:internalin A